APGRGGELLHRRGERRHAGYRVGYEQGQVLNDVQQIKLAAEFLGKSCGVVQGNVGKLAEVGGHEDAVQVDHGGFPSRDITYVRAGRTARGVVALWDRA